MTRANKYFVCSSIVAAILCMGLLVRGSVLQVPSGTWAPAPGALAEARSGAAAALLPDGRVLVTGGEGAGGPLASVEVLNLDGFFSGAAPMALPRARHVAVALKDGRVLVAGGTSWDGSATNSAEIYDPASDSWSAAGAMVEARAGHTATLLDDGRVLIAGGEAAGAASISLEVFNPVSGTFAVAGMLSSARAHHSAALLADGRVLVIGGSAGDAILASSELYDPSNGQSVAGPNLNFPRAGLSATTLLDGSVLIAGGHDGTQDLSTAEIYDPAAGTFTLSASQMTAPRRDHQALRLPYNNSVLIVGGTYAGTALALAELYLPWEGAFNPTGTLSWPRAAAAASPLGLEGALLVAGGSDGSANLDTAELYGFATLKTDKDDYTPGETVVITGRGWEPRDDVMLVLHETLNPEPHGDRVWFVTADDNGNLFDSSFWPEAHDVGVRFFLIAIGERSQAQATFTDDQVVNNIDTTIDAAPESVTITSGGSTAVGFFMQPSNTIPTGDATGCNSTGANPATVTLSVPANVTASPTSLTFTGCGIVQNVTFSSSVVGSYTISVASVTGGKPGSLWDTAPAAFTLVVNPPADTTPPVITPTVTPTPNPAGWNNSNVTVNWSVTDPESGIASSSGCGTTNLTSETAGTTLTCSATNGAALSNSASVTVKIDKTAPNAPTPGVSPSPNAAGWNNTVLVTVSFTDNGDAGAVQSGVASCTSPVTLSSETTGTLESGTCTDVAGNTSASASVTVKIDTTAPNPPTATVDPAPNADGWNSTSPVTVKFTSAGDAGGVQSGVASCTGDQQVSGDTNATPVSGTCTDEAGNSSSATTVTVKIDTSGPVITPTVTPAPNAAGWNNTDPTVTWSVTDSGSGVKTKSGCDETTVTTETDSLVLTCKATNYAGLSNSASVTIKLDKTAPNPPTPNVSPTPNAAGWNNVLPVTVTFAGNGDVGPVQSGVASCSSPVDLNSETSGTTESGTCTDVAGNESDPASVTVKIDKTPPNAPTLNHSPAPNAAGWNNSVPVTISFASNGDAGSVQSGVDSCTSDQVFNAETAGTPVSGTCTDVAGNTSAAASDTVKIDATEPQITGTASPPANSYGWNNSSVTVSFTCADTGSVQSGIATGNVAGETLSGEGAGQSVTNTGSCIDVAGNAADSATVSGINIDLTKPTATAAPSPGPNGYGWNNTDVVVTFSGSDGLSGIDSCTAPITLSAEGAGQSASGTCTDKAGNVSAPATASGINIDKTKPALAPSVTPNPALLNGSATASAGATDGLSDIDTQSCGSLDLSTVGSKSVTCTATDKAGNTATASASYSVLYASGGMCMGNLGHAILQPINFDGTSVFKQKSTVPAKFRVCDALGNSIGTPGVVSAFNIVGIFNGTTTTTVNEAVDSTTPYTEFRWSPTDMQWIFNTNTKGLQAGKTYLFRIALNDGSTIDYQFGLR